MTKYPRRTQLGLSVSEPENRAVAQAAKMAGVTISTFLRTLVAEDLKRRGLLAPHEARPD
jgi:hypothetical protein